jgi:hypothetical protein
VWHLVEGLGKVQENTMYFKPQSTKVKYQKNGNLPTSHHSSKKETEVHQ